jgi:AAA+ ATPase superfamily predicted ATPase
MKTLGVDTSSEISSADFIDREYEINVLHKYIDSRMCCQVIGPSGIGKSRLLMQVAKLAPEWSPSFKVAYVALREGPVQTIEGFVRAVCNWLVGNPVSGSTKDLLQILEGLIEEGMRPILCLDDFEEFTAEKREFTSDFFLDMRFLAQRGVSFIVSSRVPLSTLFPSISPVSPFFGVFAILRLGPLPSSEVEDFLVLYEKDGVRFSPEERNMIIGFSKGFPERLLAAYQFAAQGKHQGETVGVSLEKAETHLREMLNASYEH